MGLKIVVPGSFSNTALPVLYPDPRMNAGSLILLDPKHPEAPMSGVPAVNDRSVNLAASTANALVGAGEVRPQLIGSGWGSSYGVIERSGLGGIHVAMKQGIVVDVAHGVYYSLPTLLQTYLLANPTHSYYVSLWARITRASGETNDSSRPVLSRVSDPTNENGKYAYRLTTGLTRPNGATLIGSAGSPIADTVTTVRASLGINAFVGAPTSLGSSQVVNWGNTGSAAALFSTKPASMILYGYHLCDLTVAGLTYAQQDAIDQAEYTRQISSTGGRYFGTDTYTDPATLV